MKVAVVLFNLGAPDRPAAVRPFLRNLFSDPAIVRLPWLPRSLLASLIARRRAAAARRIYAKLGGASPLLAETEKQAAALASRLADDDDETEFGVFIAMRYWHPLIAETARKLAAYGPDRIVLLPLYPQFSTTTTASSLEAWCGAARANGLTMPTSTICCYPAQAGWIASQADLLATTIRASGCEPASMRILFSAHGLPQRIVADGDPYPEHVDRTARAIIDRISPEFDGLDWIVSYQSRVGPLEWIGPSTESEIDRGARDRKVLVVTPVAFVSEHAETLVELDIDYRELAKRLGAPGFYRVPAVATHAAFIEGLATMVVAALRGRPSVKSMPGGRICRADVKACPCVAAARGAAASEEGCDGLAG